MTNRETTLQTSRPTITGPGMHALLNHEFARLKAGDCTRCSAPLPYWGPAPGNKVFWYMQTPPACPHGCHKVLIELWARLSTEYRIAPPGDENAFRQRFVRAAGARGQGSHS